MKTFEVYILDGSEHTRGTLYPQHPPPPTPCQLWTKGVLLAIQKSNHTGTTFDFKFACFLISGVQNLEQIKIRDANFIIYVLPYSDVNIGLIYDIKSFFSFGFVKEDIRISSTITSLCITFSCPSYGTKYSRIDKVKFLADSLYKKTFTHWKSKKQWTRTENIHFDLVITGNKYFLANKLITNDQAYWNATFTEILTIINSSKTRNGI